MTPELIEAIAEGTCKVIGMAIVLIIFYNLTKD